MPRGAVALRGFFCCIGGRCWIMFYLWAHFFAIYRTAARWWWSLRWGGVIMFYLSVAVYFLSFFCGRLKALPRAGLRGVVFFIFFAFFCI